ncbi:gfo/Idh/MocA family oxidoreductase, partial [Aneurinibacillus sp. REN35]
EEETAQLINQIEQDPFGTPGHQHIIADMVQAIEKDCSPLITGEDGKNALKLVLAIYRASELQKPLNVNDL